MKVSELMTQGVKACGIHDTLQRAAQIMWESDCGCVPVVDDEARVVGMLTDRDICMAGYTQGTTFAEIPVSTAMAKQVFGVAEDDLVEAAESMMRDKQIRRVPVLDGGGKLRGLLSLNDIARHTHRTKGRRGNGLSGDSIAETLAAICKPHRPEKTQTPAATTVTPRNGGSGAPRVT